MADRAPVQGQGTWWLRDHPACKPTDHPPGTISWAEHVEAWQGYARRFGANQSAERMAQRGGFSWGELLLFLGHEPTTWEPLEVRRG